MEKTSENKDRFASRAFYVHVAGNRLRVKMIEPQDFLGEKCGATLVFLHEGLGCIELWRDFPEVLCSATGCRGLVYERKGYGDSDVLSGPWTADYLIEEATVDLPGVLAACDIDDAVLIGHSDGGTIALIASATNGDAVRGIITEAAHIFVEDITLEGIRKAVEAFATTRLKEKLARYHKDRTETVFRRWAERWLSDEFRSWNINAYLPRITCPALIIQGEDDEYGTSAQLEGIARGVSGPVAAKLIPDCGHIPHFQARDTVLKEMAQFVRGVTA
ncbi:MAG: alpha/beta hydrolase [Pseudomonadota bacterium]